MPATGWLRLVRPSLMMSLPLLILEFINEYPGGDHVIFLGQVAAALEVNNYMLCDEKTALNVAEDMPVRSINSVIEDTAAPLAFYRGQYRCLASDHNQLHVPMRDKERRYFANVSGAGVI